MRYEEILESPKPLSGTYVAAYYDEDTVNRLVDFQQQLQIPNPIPSDKFHTTIVYSRSPVNWKPLSDLEVVVKPLEWKIWDTQDNKFCLVLCVSSNFLQKRFDLAMARGATYDFDTYVPHVTFSYDVGADYNPSVLPIPDFDLVVNHEFSEPLDPK